MMLVLGVVTLLSSGVVAVIFALTEESIEKVQQAKVNAAIAMVVPEFDSFEAVTRFVDGDTLRFYIASRGGEHVGTAVETFTNTGYSGLIKMMVGFLPDGTIYHTEVISHTETPGLGDKIERSKGTFPLQFDGKHPTTFRLATTKSGGDIEAITAATITSDAFGDAIQRAFDTLMELNIGTTEE